MNKTPFRDYYYILGLEQNAEPDDIKKAFRKLSLKYHPDKNDGDDFLCEMFKKINEAYETLSDPYKRKDFDARLSNYQSSTNYKDTESPADKTEESNSQSNDDTAVNPEYNSPNTVTNEELDKSIYEHSMAVLDKLEKDIALCNAKQRKIPQYITIKGFLIISLILLTMLAFKPKSHISRPINDQSTKKSKSLNAQIIKSQHKSIKPDSIAINPTPQTSNDSSYEYEEGSLKSK